MSESEYRFEVAISFAGDKKRDLVRKVATILKARLGEGKVFFDEWFESELAGPDAHIVLQKYYGKLTRLVVTCVCKRYNEKPWTQEEWRAIQAFERDLRDAGTKNVKRMRFLPLRFGDGEIDGLFATAIVPDVRDREPNKIAVLILKRLDHAKGHRAAATSTNDIDSSLDSLESTSGGGVATITGLQGIRLNIDRDYDSYSETEKDKNPVAAELADECLVQLGYCIGLVDPVSVMVNSYGTGKVSDEVLAKLVRKVFPLSPHGIIDHLKLRKPVYRNTAAYGHFGRSEFSWEKVDVTEELLAKARNVP